MTNASLSIEWVSLRFRVTLVPGYRDWLRGLVFSYRANNCAARTGRLA